MHVLKLCSKCIIVIDCKSFYDAIEKNESLGIGLSEKRTTIEVAATRQQTHATGIKTRWANSDRQLADILTKPTALAASMIRLQQIGNGKIVWDADFTSAKTYERRNGANTLRIRNQVWRLVLQIAREPCIPTATPTRWNRNLIYWRDI